MPITIPFSYEPAEIGYSRLSVVTSLFDQSESVFWTEKLTCDLISERLATRLRAVFQPKAEKPFLVSCTRHKWYILIIRVTVSLFLKFIDLKTSPTNYNMKIYLSVVHSCRNSRAIHCIILRQKSIPTPLTTDNQNCWLLGIVVRTSLKELNKRWVPAVLTFTDSAVKVDP